MHAGNHAAVAHVVGGAVEQREHRVVIFGARREGWGFEQVLVHCTRHAVALHRMARGRRARLARVRTDRLQTLARSRRRAVGQERRVEDRGRLVRSQPVLLLLHHTHEEGAHLEGGLHAVAPQVETEPIFQSII